MVCGRSAFIEIAFLCFFFLFSNLSDSCYAQSQFSLSIPVINSKVQFNNNWNPPTAVNPKNTFNGTSIAWGANLNYSFALPFLLSQKGLLFTVGAGYITQRFDIERPFDYSSPLYPIFYTDHYSYDCFQWTAGIAYKYNLGKGFHLLTEATFNGLHSFRQKYTPTTNHGYGHLTQINNSKINFGRLVTIQAGIEKSLSRSFAINLNLMVPVYTRWRNDVIFKDDASKYSHPEHSWGVVMGGAYTLNRNGLD